MYQEERNLNVCLANDSFPPLIDGVANTVINYAKLIDSKYGSAVVAVPRYPGVSDNYPFKVVRYSSINTTRLMGYRTGYPFSAKAMRSLCAAKPDIIHCHCPAASAFLCRELRDLVNSPLVFTYHTKFDIDVHRAIKYGFLQDAAIRNILNNIDSCDEVWAVNGGAADNLKQLGYAGDILIMENGVDFERGPSPEEDISLINKQFSLKPGVFLFLFVGRMLWYKGQRIILDALKRLKNAGKEFYMVFIGDGDNLEDIKKYAAGLKLDGSCLFTGAIRDRDVLRAWYSRADLFLLPSVFDNNPIVVKEAAACKTASVLIKGSSSAEGVRDGINGILIDESADALARALSLLYDNPSLAVKAGEGALRDLYVSWEEKVDKAFHRYAEIREAWQNGDIPKRTAKYDKVIEAMSDIYGAFEKLRGVFRDF